MRVVFSMLLVVWSSVFALKPSEHRVPHAALAALTFAWRRQALLLTKLLGNALEIVGSFGPGLDGIPRCGIEPGFSWKHVACQFRG